MLEYLFGSKTRQKLLRLFFNNPQKDFFVRELTRTLDLQINAVRRELDHLLAAQIILQNDEPSENVSFSGAMAEAKRKYYKLNPNGLLNPELKALLIKDHSAKEKELVESLKNLDSVDYLLLSGKFVGIEEATIDLLIVGNIGSKELHRLINSFESESGEEIRYTLMTVKEFSYRREVADKFLSDLLSKKTLVVIDKLGKSKLWKK